MDALLIILIPILIQIESSGKADAIGKHNDVGILQITPIYLEDVNRILGHTEYVLEDRFDRAKSIKMTKTYLKHYAPKISESISTLDKLLIIGSLHSGGPRGHLKHSKKLTNYRVKISKYYNERFN